jgi:SAM-dependent methyltransferase
LSGERRLGESVNAVEREQAYSDDAYGSYIPRLFAQPAVVEFRRYLVKKILRATGASARSRVLSIGCGIGDTELLLAPHVAHVTGVDLSPQAVAIARGAASARGLTLESLPRRGLRSSVALVRLCFHAAGWLVSGLADRLPAGTMSRSSTHTCAAYQRAQQQRAQQQLRTDRKQMKLGER